MTRSRCDFKGKMVYRCVMVCLPVYKFTKILYLAPAEQRIRQPSFLFRSNAAESFLSPCRCPSSL